MTRLEKMADDYAATLKHWDDTAPHQCIEYEAYIAGFKAARVLAAKECVKIDAVEVHRLSQIYPDQECHRQPMTSVCVAWSLECAARIRYMGDEEE